ncbi:fibronectin type III domain-containing protein [Frankia sp. CiP3]|uniref:fibronectin type III domain-containing protein n=1 Tax=Frankia sp. CiP3 TaxID=2880971 RepID=UPI001EF5FB4B|nr:fibronectin type III domain-containing protein [Frankia sp. CiP3]
MSNSQGLVFASAEWVPGGGEWWANFTVVVSNYSTEDLVDPEISFTFAEGRIIRNNYGLVFEESDRPVEAVTGRFVAERKIILAQSSQEFTVAMQNGGPGAGTDPGLLPNGFTVNGQDANPPVDNDPPTVPEKLRATGWAPHSLQLTWDPSTDNVAVASYVIEYGTPGGETHTWPTRTPGATVSRLNSLTEYRLRVRAVDVSGNRSDLSEEISATTTAPLPDLGDWDARRAPFVDYTAWPNPKIAEYGSLSGIDAFFTGFLVAQPSGDKKVYWGGYPSLGEATTSDFGKEDMNAFTAHGGKVILSFGGASNVPLEDVETDVSRIAATYRAILANYGATYFDFDFEGGFIHNQPGLERHVAAISQVLATQPALKISYTLPVDGAPGSLVGFNDGGVRLLQLLADAGIQPSLINGMLMEFGQTSPPDAYECCVIALNGMFTQIAAAWPGWDEQKVWRRIGACPMFGRHINGKIFTLDHMRRLVDFARTNNLGCLSGWDASRDYNQGRLPECADFSGSDLAKCTYVEQNSFDFSKIIATYQPEHIPAASQRR